MKAFVKNDLKINIQERMLRNCYEGIHENTFKSTNLWIETSKKA